MDYQWLPFPLRDWNTAVWIISLVSLIGANSCLDYLFTPGPHLKHEARVADTDAVDVAVEIDR